MGRHKFMGLVIPQQMLTSIKYLIPNIIQVASEKWLQCVCFPLDSFNIFIGTPKDGIYLETTLMGLELSLEPLELML